MKKHCSILFEPLTRSDFPLLLRWLSSAHLKEWWSSNVAWTATLIEQKYTPYVAGYRNIDGNERASIHAYIVHCDATPIGYIQYYDVHDDPVERRKIQCSLPLSCAGIDFYIGEESHTGKGLGPIIVNQFTNIHLFPSFESALVDPATNNIRAIKAYEKAGFRKIGEDATGATTYMLKEKNKK